MKIFSQRILLNYHQINSYLALTRLRPFSTQSDVLPQRELTPFYRTPETNPSKHNELHHGLFYKIPDNIANRLFLLAGFEKEIQSILKLFRETAIMVRKPATDLIGYLNKTDFTKPPNSYVLYGPIGSGKTFTLNHILHYGFNEKFVLLHCPRPSEWINFPQEQSVSVSNPRRIDTSLDAAFWLQIFKAQNFALLEELKLTCLNKYTWSQREITNPGDNLLSIVDHGINRIKHASDCLAVLLKELQLHSAKGNCRLLVVVDKVNAFYEPSRLMFPDKTMCTPDDITIARAFKKLFKKDWKNGAIVTAVCKKLVVPFRILPLTGIQKKERSRDRTYKIWGPFKVNHLSDYPKALLTDEGFQDFDPFIPIEVGKYTEKELNTCLDYYQDRQWLQRPVSKTEEAREEIKFLSGLNPGQVYHICSNI